MKYRIWKDNKVPLIFIILVCLILFFFKLGERGFWDPTEDEYAQVSQEMLKLNHWLLPTVNKWPYPLKPPLYMWLTSLISIPKGRVTEFTARLPSAIAGIGGVLCIYLLGSKLFSRRAGFISSLILATSARYVYFSRWAEIYALFTFWICLTLLFFYMGYREGRGRIFYPLMYCSMALATLTWGPVGLILPFLTVFLYLLAIKDLKHLVTLRIGWGMALYILITAPWYIASGIMEGKEYAYGHLITTNLTRYFNPWTHKEPFYFYFEKIPMDFLPWSFFLPGIFLVFFSSKRAEERKDMLFPMLWFLGSFTFFSFSQAKRGGYILSCYPALSLLVGYLWDKYIIFVDVSYWKKMILIPFYLLILVLFLLGVILPAAGKIWYPEWLYLTISQGIIFLLGSIGILWFILKKRPLLSFLAFILTLTFTVAFVISYVVPKLEPLKSYKPFSLAISDIMRSEGKFGMYRHLRPTYIFYTGKFAELISQEKALNNFLNSKERVFVLMEKEEYQKIKEVLNPRPYVLLKDKVDGKTMVFISNRY